MLLRIQGYNVGMVFKPGSEMIVADALSRLPKPNKIGELDTNGVVHTIEDSAEFLHTIGTRCDEC